MLTVNVGWVERVKYAKGCFYLWNYDVVSGFDRIGEKPNTL